MRTNVPAISTSRAITTIETALGSAASDSDFLPSADQAILFPTVGQLRDTTDKLAVSRYTFRTLSNSIRHRAAIVKQLIADSRIAVVDNDGIAQI